MTYLIIAASSIGLLLAVMAMLKERRLRIALQTILRKLLDQWRIHAQKNGHDHAGDHRANDHRMP